MSSEDEKSSKKPGSEDTSSLAARRARLRGSLSKPPSAEGHENDVQTASSSINNVSLPPNNQNMTQATPNNPDIYLAVSNAISNIEQTMSACATNLAALQKIATEQKELLQTFNDTLKNQTFSEIGLNFNAAVESISNSMEPLKSASELVSAIDQLVASLHSKDAKQEGSTITADQLVANLADQLSVGSIDPWMFKCAYTAVFPADHPADLLRRLVELLGTQRLSGDLFRKAYEAVQITQPQYPQASGSQSATGSFPENTVVDEQLRRELDEVRRTNEDLRSSLDEREKKFEQVLTSKDNELKETRELLSSRHEEFDSKSQETSKQEQQYKAMLEAKDAVLSEKDSELNMLRSQMEELRMQTQDMVKDLQQQISKGAKEKSPAQPAPPKPAATNFFEPAQSKAPAKPTASKSFFEKDEPQQAASAQATPQPQAQQVQQSQPTQQQTQPVQPAEQPRQTASVPIGSGTGSYGSGVRAQVFEVIVRQALAGAPWKEICAGPMQVNNISAEEVEAEVKRRQSMLNK